MDIVILLIGAALGFFSAILTDPVRDLIFGPKLKVEFNPEKPGFVTDTKESAGGNNFIQASYIRVLVTNNGRQIAKQCRAYLVAFEKWNTALKRFETTSYCEAIQLAWSASPEDGFGAIDIPKGIGRFIDVVSVRDRSNDIRIHLKIHLYRYLDMLTKETGRFRYTILVGGDNLKPQSVKVDFEWDGDFKQFKALEG